MTSPLRPALDSTSLAELGGFAIEVVEEVDSTNRVATERARAGAEAWTVVVAEHQTAGRGRLDRVWEMPARAGLMFSVVVRPQLSPTRWGWLPLVTGLAIAEAIGSVAAVKWPNDVLIGDRKVAGVLVEMVSAGAQGRAVIGIGINVSLTTEELPIPTATSLALEGLPADRTAVLAAVLGRLHAHVGMLSAASDAELIAAYRARSATIGRSVEVQLPDGSVLTGVADGIDGAGQLVVAGRAVNAGDVVHARLS